jgi:hypothetical protein
METNDKAFNEQAAPKSRNVAEPISGAAKSGQKNISGQQGSPTGQDNIVGDHQQTGVSHPAPGEVVKMEERLDTHRTAPPPPDLADH